MRQIANVQHVAAPGGRQIDRREQTVERFAVGDQVRVFVARVDAFKRQIDFAPADQRSAKGRQTRHR